MKKIKLKMSIVSTVVTAVVIAIILIFNALVAMLGNKLPLSVDLTRDKVYAFSEQTKDLMKNLDDEITAYCLLPEGTESEYIDYIKTYLDKYQKLSKHFNVEYVDPYKNPGFMQKYNDGENQANVGSVIIENGKKSKVISFGQLYYQNNVTNALEIDMERKVTNAVMSVTGKLSSSNIYFTEGHDELDSTFLSEILQEEGHTCNALNIAINGIPEDASMIFSMAPISDFTAEEIETLDRFMDKGGKFIIVADPKFPESEKIDSYLEEWGLSLNHDLVIESDTNSAISSGTGLPIPVARLQEHTITKKLMDSKSPLALPISSSISIVNPRNGAYPQKLLMTSEKAYGKKNLDSTTAGKEDGDISGPLCLAAISEKQGENPSAVMVIGSSYAVLSSIVSEKAYLNGDFILNSINYLSGNSSASSIRAKKISPEMMTMTQNQVVLSMILLQYVLPTLIILIGLFVWIRRRFK